jgi:hypothetical protein
LLRGQGNPSVALNWGFLAQHRAAAALPSLRLGRPAASLRSLFGSRRWLAGTAVGLAGWALYVAALARAPLSLVQAASAAGIGVLALLVHLQSGQERLSRSEWEGVGRPAGIAGLSAWIATSVVVAATAAGPGARAFAGGAGLGVAAGVLYAGADVATKAATGGRLWLVPVILAASAAAFACLQLGFQRGRPLARAGVASLLTNALPMPPPTMTRLERDLQACPENARKWSIRSGCLLDSARSSGLRSRSTTSVSPLGPGVRQCAFLTAVRSRSPGGLPRAGRPYLSLDGCRR